MRISLLFFFFFLSFQISFAQNEESLNSFFTDPGNLQGLNYGNASYIGKKPVPGTVQGEVWLNAEWEEAIIYPKEGDAQKTLARYRVYDDEMHILVKQQELKLHKRLVQAVRLGDKSFLVYPHFDKNNKNKKVGYLELLVGGNENLLRKYSIKVVQPDYNPALSTGSRDAQLVLQETLYIAQKGKTAKVLKKGKKHILETLSKHQKAIIKYVKLNNLSWKKTDDIVKIVAYYNELTVI